jgi:hypothetical protein
MEKISSGTLSRHRTPIYKGLYSIEDDQSGLKRLVDLCNHFPLMWRTVELSHIFISMTIGRDNADMELQ